MRYVAYLRNAFLQSIAYRIALYLSLEHVTLLLVIQYYLWTAVFDTSADPGGLSLLDMLTYVLLARALEAFFTMLVDTEMGSRIRRGTIAADLARPVDLQVMWFFQSLGSSLVNLCLVTIPVYLILLALGMIRPPVSLATAGCFLLSVSPAYILLYALAYCFGLLSFWTKTGWGLSDIKDALLLIFSGSFIPLELYPGWLRTIAEVLPFQGIMYTPVKIYMSGPSASVVHLLLVQAAWTLALLAFSRLIWNKAASRLVIYGG